MINHSIQFSQSVRFFFPIWFASTSFISSLQYIDTAMHTHKPYFLNPESSQDLSELSITLVTSSGTQNDLVVCLMGFILFLHKGGKYSSQTKAFNELCIYSKIKRVAVHMYLYLYIYMCVCASLACFVPLVWFFNFLHGEGHFSTRFLRPPVH